MTTDFDRHLHAFANTVQDPTKMSPQQRHGVARLLNVHPSALETLHQYAKRHMLPPPGPAGPQKVSDAQFASMPASERLDYARQFDQSQFRGPDR
jgi:hypothetical protein